MAGKPTPTTGIWTEGEWRILELVAETHGWVWALRHAARTLAEARMIDGDLDEVPKRERAAGGSVSQESSAARGSNRDAV